MQTRAGADKSGADESGVARLARDLEGAGETAAASPFAIEKGLPGIGSLLPISRDALGFFTRLLRDRGDRVMLRVLGRRVVLLTHPDDMEEVLVRNREIYGRSNEIRALRPIFGDGLLSSEGELWRRQRALIQPSFQRDALRKYSSIMLATIERLLAAWRAGETRNMHREMMRYTREVICAVLFGETLSNPQALGEAVDTVFGNLRSETLYLQLWRRLPLRRSRDWNAAVKVLNAAISGAIEERRKRATPGDDLLGALLQAHDAEGAMADQQVHDEILTFFLAGHETAGLGLTWACLLLATHPEAQERVAEETAAATRGGGLLPEHLTKLPWTTAVVKEALRLYPPVWSMGRTVTRDTSLGGQRMRRGTDVWLCLYQLHRDERWFREPERFLPERWIDQPPPKPFTYLPFGIGPRVCIGQHFATAEAVLGLASTVSRFRLTAPTGRPITPSAWITLRPKQPVMLQIGERTRRG